MPTFSATVNEWVARSLDRVADVRRVASFDVIALMQLPGPSVARPGGGKGGRMPIDLGFLRSSLKVTLGGEYSGSAENPSGGSYQYADAQTFMTINSAKPGDDIFAMYAAAYAARLNYGFSGTDAKGRAYNQTGYGFVEFAAAQWQDVVRRAVEKTR